MKSKYIGGYLILLFIIIIIFLFFFWPEAFYRLFKYSGPGGPFVHPPGNY